MAPKRIRVSNEYVWDGGRVAASGKIRVAVNLIWVKADLFLHYWFRLQLTTTDTEPGKIQTGRSRISFWPQGAVSK